MLPCRPRGKHSCAPPFCLFGVAFPFCSFARGGNWRTGNSSLWAGKEERGGPCKTRRGNRERLVIGFVLHALLLVLPVPGARGVHRHERHSVQARARKKKLYPICAESMRLSGARARVASTRGQGVPSRGCGTLLWSLEDACSFAVCSAILTPSARLTMAYRICKQRCCGAESAFRVLLSR